MDAELDKLFQAISSIYNFKQRLAKCVEHSVEWIVDPIHTGRNSISELGKAEKTTIGTKLEDVVVNEFKWEPDQILDCCLIDIPFDIKFTTQHTWMIPSECYRNTGICFCVKLIDEESMSAGLIRATEDNLTKGKNQDKKKSISKQGRDNMNWLLENHPLKIKYSGWRLIGRSLKKMVLG